MQTIKKILVFCIAAISITACNTGELATQDIASPTSTSTIIVTPSPIATPTETQTPEEPEGDFPEPDGEPLTEWKGIPISPQAISGEESEGLYIYTTDLEPGEVQAYYEEEMGDRGWDLFALGEGENIDYSPMMMFQKGENSASILIAVNQSNNRTLVMLHRQGETEIESSAKPTLPPDLEVKRTLAGIFCPPEIKEAKELFNEAISLNDQGKVGEAEQAYLKAIELDPKFCDAMDNLGVLYRNQGNIDEAIYWYQRSIDVYPENPVAHQNLAVAHFILGNTEKAIAEYEIMIDLDPKNPEGYYGLGSLYMQISQFDKAIEYAEAAEILYLETSSPLVSDARLLLGITYYALEDCGTAISYFEQAAKTLENHPAFNYFFGMCYLSPDYKDMELAKYYLERAQELGIDLSPELIQILEE